MAASILVRDILFRASSQLLDIAPQFQRWTERELVDWLNDAQRVIAKFMPQSCSRVDAVRMKPGTRQSIANILSAELIPGDGSAARNISGIALLDVVRNMGSDGLTPGRIVRRVDRETLDASNPDWHTATAKTPLREYAIDPRTPLVFFVSPPVPAAGSWWLELSYMANPAEIANPGNAYGYTGNSTVTISVDDKHADDILNYILARAQMKDAEYAGNAQLASSFANAFITSLNAQVAALTGVNPNLESLPLAPQPLAAAK